MVAFTSQAPNLVEGDTNGRLDAFVRDRKTGKTRRVSVSGAGVQGNGDSFDAHISADGRFVAFASRASNLVRGDTNGREDIFVRDRRTGETTRVSVSSAGRQANRNCFDPAISANGRFVAFGGGTSNLVRGGTNGTWDVFVHDRRTGKTRRVNVSSAGAQANGWSGGSAISISASGRFVAWAAG